MPFCCDLRAVQERGPDMMADEDETPPCATCRTCCSAPHGAYSIVASIFATIGLALAATALQSCNFMTANFLFCQDEPPPPPTYAFCGDCHCIKDHIDDPCPSGDQVPPTSVDVEYIRQLRSVNLTNQYELICNPYNNTGRSCTNPPQDQAQIDLWESATCGVKYDMSSLDSDQCPTQYSVQTYNSIEDLDADGAFLTHWGACGVCSSLQDLATYLEYPDLTTKGTECSLRAFDSHEDGIACYQEVGYSRDCAEMWVFNGINTKDKCFNVCVDFAVSGTVSNGPYPECRLADCLLCDEEMSGPFFQAVAARSRRRAGLLSKIARPCDKILLVPQIYPCEATGGSPSRRHLAAVKELPLEKVSFDEFTRRLQAPVAPAAWTPPRYNETCFLVENNVGLRRFNSSESQYLFGDDDFFLGETQQYEKTFYDTCNAYTIRNANFGYWRTMHDEFMGGPYDAANTFGALAVAVGGTAMLLMWVGMCVAWRPVFWRAMAVLLGLSAVFSWLTLLFLASDMCDRGCQWQKGATDAVCAGVAYLIAVPFAVITGPARKGRSVKCGCCAEEEDFYVATTVDVTEVAEDNGTTTVEKVTTGPDGRKIVEVTKTKRVNAKDYKKNDTEPIISGVSPTEVEPLVKAEEADDEEHAGT